MKIVGVLILIVACEGADVSTGKSANQSSTKNGYEAGYALDRSNFESGAPGSFSLELDEYPDQIVWWEVDLGQDYDVAYIVVTASTYINWWILLNWAKVKVFDSTRGQSDQYPAIQDADSAERFIFCDPAVPVQFVRLESTGDLCIGHLEVQSKDIYGTGSGDDSDCPRTVYTRADNNRVADPITMVGALSAAHCGIFCEQLEACISFSYTIDDHIDANCRLSDNHNTTFDSDSVFNTKGCNIL